MVHLATIYEVAALAGVSPATVSRVFNGHGVSEQKANAVRAAARELAFTPNRTARTLRKQASEIIALVIPDIENPYFTELARGVEDVASEAGYSVVLCNTDADSAKEDRYLDIAISEHMAGLIVASASPATDLRAVLDAGRPVVAVDRGVAYEVDKVVMANRAAGESATRELLRQGFRRIAFISGPRGVDTAQERAEGWRAVMQPHISGDALDELLVESSFRVQGGRDAMQALLARADPPDAVVAGNNLVGVGAIQVLSEQALTPPLFGVAVVGSLPFTTLSPSSVTVVRLPARDMGVRAARLLMGRIGGDVSPARTIVLDAELRPHTAAP